MSKTGRLLAIAALVAITVGCDRTTKYFAATSLVGTPRQSFFGDTLRLDYAENTGGFLSLGADWPAPVRTGVFTIGTGALMIAAIVAGVWLRASGLSAVGLALVCSGGLSNLADRLIKGTVIDFLNVGVGPIRTGIFNVADMAVLAGAVLFLIAHNRRQE